MASFSRNNINENAARVSRYSSVILAKSFGISQRQLQRRAQVGKLHQWLTHLRLSDAKQLLAPHKLVKEVADFLGYKQVSHFSRDFKKLFGVSPEEFAHSKGRTWVSEGFEAQYLEMLQEWNGEVGSKLPEVKPTRIDQNNSKI